uniref:Arylsulfatase B n=1 Tax=Cacopsylla melanoneura TaxID=428564 RepID=A0A8D8UW69_9HEMI
MVRLYTKYEFNTFFFILYSVVILCTKNVSGGQPNIIFIVADDLGWNDVGFHGENAIPTPNIDALAYNGIILNRHYTLPTCSPSRAALLTGRYPFRYGIERPIGAGIPESVPVTEKLLPQYLKELGYATHLIGKWHIGCHREELLPFNRGFDNHTGYWNGYLNFNDSVHHSNNARGFDARQNMKEYATEMSSKYLTDFLTDESVKIIKSHNQTKPLFLQFSHAAVHTAQMGTKDQEAGVLQVADEYENNRTFGHIKNPNRRLFAGILKSMDDSVGRVIESLHEANMLENSLIVFISDNGGPTTDGLFFHGNTGSNWPLRGAKYSVYEGGVRNVAAIWSPLLSKGQVFNHLFHLTDWLPTLYHIAGRSIPS